MANNPLPYDLKWFDEIRRLEKTDKAEGGQVTVGTDGAPTSGAVNHPHMQMASRTGYLRKVVDSVISDAYGKSLYGSFVDGATVTSEDQVMMTVEGDLYYCTKGFPVTVEAGSGPGDDWVKLSNSYGSSFSSNLGNYEDGPLTFTREDQEMRKDGIKYYLSSSTSLPYKTTGITATTWETDKDNFVAVGSLDLSQELSNTDGSGAGLVGFDPTQTYLSGTIGSILKAQFQEAQSLQYWYDITGDWNKAWDMAQLAVYVHGLSPKIKFPNAVIEISRPFLHGPALGDWIHENYPSLNFYNSTTGKYAAIWPCYVEGVIRKHQDGGFDIFSGTQVVFTGSKSQSDQTWMNYGVFHCAPTEIEQFNHKATVLKFWPGYCYISGVNIRSKNTDGTSFASVHGVVVYNGTQCILETMSVYQVYGGGYILDWTWDSIITNTKAIQTGRVSPLYGQYITDGNTDIEYTHYAPYNVINSSGTDNSNFIRIYDNHAEDNYNSAVDLIVNGNSSPVWVRNLHFENDGSSGVRSLRTRVAPGNFGVKVFGQDGVLGYDYTNRPDTLTGGYIDWDAGATYSTSYADLAYVKRYSGLIIRNLRWPNSGDIIVRSGNAPVSISVLNSGVGNITLSGGNASLTPLTLVDVDCGNISADFTFGLRMQGVRSTGSLSITNSYVNASSPHEIEGVFASVTGAVTYATMKLWLTSTTVPSSIQATRGNIEIMYDAYQRNVLGYA